MDNTGMHGILSVALFITSTLFTLHNRRHVNNSRTLSNKSSLVNNEKTLTCISSETLPNVHNTKSLDCSDCTLANSAPKVDRHLLICGKVNDMNWPKKIEKEVDTFAGKLSIALKQEVQCVETPLNIKMTACNEANSVPGFQDVIIYPEKIRISLSFESNDECISHFFRYVSHATLPDDLPPGVMCSSRSLPWETLILVCTHGNRDKRCGRAGPIIMDALQAELCARNISPSKITVRSSSHIGGHRYAGTLIVYPQGQWYGFMTKKNVTQLLDCIQAGGILDKCFRGFCNLSW